ncbi:hypothetical protein AKO1_014455 [Acrasis kona]|uniref:Swiss Army Knife RNA repair protein HAD domain-containing protein n=1 Tax=Acrasis kona TaxID=1008807 RepID=A0AAW2YZC4_9EUKA
MRKIYKRIIKHARITIPINQISDQQHIIIKKSKSTSKCSTLKIRNKNESAFITTPNNFENIVKIKKIDNASSIHTLHIFDFDSTLFKTPDPETGRDFYESVTGESWPHNGWWGLPNTLMKPFEVEKGPAFSDFLSHIALPNTHTIVMTGRHSGFKDILLDIFTKHGTLPASIVMKPTNKTDTLRFKLAAIQQQVDELPNIERIIMWEDRQEHAEAFVNALLKRPNKSKLNILVYLVEPNGSTILVPKESPNYLGKPRYESYLRDISSVPEAFNRIIKGRVQIVKNKRKHKVF